MRLFRDLYLVVSYALVMLQIGFVSIFLYNRYMYDRLLYYGGDKKIEEISLNYFYVLRFMLYSSLSLMVIWAVMTPLAVLGNKRSVQPEDHISMHMGVIGFLWALLMLYLDPFGMFKWLTK